MKLLYHNYAIGAPIGGGTHAREALAALDSLPGVAVTAWPPAETIPGAIGGSPPNRKSKLWFLPKPWQGWLRFWLKPLGKEIDHLSSKLGNDYNVLYFRQPWRMRMVPVIKQRFPDLHLCVEINALLHSQDLARTPLSGYWLRKEVFLASRADSIVVVSHYLKDQLVNWGIDGDKILVNPNGVNLDLFSPQARECKYEVRQQLNIPETAFVLGYVGGMESFRKLPLMIRQLLEIMQYHKNIFVVLAGDGQDRSEIERIIKGVEPTLRSRIRYNGIVPYSEAPKLMSTFDCALFPYTAPYVSPLKLFEYLAMALPVIGPNTEPVSDVFQNGRHLLLADQSGEGFIELIEEFIANKDKRELIARQGYDLVANNFTWAHNAERMIQFIESRMPCKTM